MEREESRGGHVRSDFPDESNDLVHHIIQEKGKKISTERSETIYDHVQSKFQHLELIIGQALNEDIGTGDITTNALIPETMVRTATMVAKTKGIIAGMEVAEAVFKHLSPQIVWKPFVRDGDAVEKGTLLVEMSGSFRALLTGERLALNFLQRMSGIATMTRLLWSM